MDDLRGSRGNGLIVSVVNETGGIERIAPVTTAERSYRNDADLYGGIPLEL